MPFRLRTDTSLPGGTHDGALLKAGSIVADRHLSAYVRHKIDTGDEHYVALFEPLTDEEAALVGHNAEGDPAPPSWPDEATPPRDLRWSGSNPGDEEHAGELDARLTELESRVTAIEQSSEPRSFVIASPMAGVIGSEVRS